MAENETIAVKTAKIRVGDSDPIEISGAAVDELRLVAIEQAGEALNRALGGWVGQDWARADAWDVQEVIASVNEADRALSVLWELAPLPDEATNG